MLLWPQYRTYYIREPITLPEYGFALHNLDSLLEERPANHQGMVLAGLTAWLHALGLVESGQLGEESGVKSPSQPLFTKPLRLGNNDNRLESHGD